MLPLQEKIKKNFKKRQEKLFYGYLGGVFCYFLQLSSEKFFHILPIFIKMVSLAESRYNAFHFYSKFYFFC